MFINSWSTELSFNYFYREFEIMLCLECIVQHFGKPPACKHTHFESKFAESFARTASQIQYLVKTAIQRIVLNTQIWRIEFGCVDQVRVYPFQNSSENLDWIFRV